MPGSPQQLSLRSLPCLQRCLAQPQVLQNQQVQLYRTSTASKGEVYAWPHQLLRTTYAGAAVHNKGSKQSYMHKQRHNIADSGSPWQLQAPA
jgi:hypothetical protein